MIVYEYYATYIALFFDREQRARRSAGWTNSAGGRFLGVYKPNSSNVALRGQKKIWLLMRKNVESLENGVGTHHSKVPGSSPAALHAPSAKPMQSAATRAGRTRDGPEGQEREDRRR